MEDRTGRPVTEAARAETRRLYFESVRLKAPGEYQPSAWRRSSEPRATRRGSAWTSS